MSALPGFPGASHLYHIGATGFFLDHPEHITLSPQQAATLGKARENALRALGESARKVAAAEEQLWQLTAADQPSSASVEAKVRELEKLRGDQRLAFIRAVGEAAKVLTDEQRQALLGQLPPSPNPAAGMGQAIPQPGGSMGGGMMMDDDAMEMPPAGGGSMGAGGGGMGHM
ncbi:periplasmic heavy metal sensor [Tautonia sociabilis]|uniref:Periplasmic heavy metal sensor n=2 Tax=Tautonia sociabilis TaxID=2080755 RepID=A0A432MEA0_9BACT|nr:periplasmic heavy metal sensor [Tautonia sociabilis]